MVFYIYIYIYLYIYIYIYLYIYIYIYKEKSVESCLTTQTGALGTRHVPKKLIPRLFTL